MDALSLLEELQTIARNGLHFTKSPYDRERYERLLELTCRCYGEALDLPPNEVRSRLSREVGYITPKVSTAAAVFDEADRILLVKRPDNERYCLPSGWLDPRETPEEGAVRETEEETGIEARVLQFVDSFALAADAEYGPHGTITLAYLCERVGGELTISHEALESGYYRLEEVTDWHANHDRIAALAFEAWSLRKAALQYAGMR